MCVCVCVSLFTFESPNPVNYSRQPPPPRHPKHGKQGPATIPARPSPATEKWKARCKKETCSIRFAQNLSAPKSSALNSTGKSRNLFETFAQIRSKLSGAKTLPLKPPIRLSHNRPSDAKITTSPPYRLCVSQTRSRAAFRAGLGV